MHMPDSEADPTAPGVEPGIFALPSSAGVALKKISNVFECSSEKGKCVFSVALK